MPYLYRMYFKLSQAAAKNRCKRAPESTPGSPFLPHFYEFFSF
ncbi:hypothetical protein Cabys_2118 [Caldithrix abyssi DSM 13497]|uniref:Uncharacterized protein n=1 Tax=Caldithrix abyssi DSM 13497 TaxID=880073 RepID=A0A1J1C843_CALAY|nr:hypothetical protein Cabys_2118 [Caldithrix abyssi DSM 13497]